MSKPTKHTNDVRSPDAFQENGLRCFVREMRGKSVTILGGQLKESGMFGVQAVIFQEADEWEGDELAAAQASLRGVGSAVREAVGTFRELEDRIDNALRESLALFIEGHNHPVDGNGNRIASDGETYSPGLHVVDILIGQALAVVGCWTCGEYDRGWAVPYADSNGGRSVELGRPVRIALQWVNEQESATGKAGWVALDADLMDELKAAYAAGDGIKVADGETSPSANEGKTDDDGKPVIPLRTFLEQCDAQLVVLDEGYTADGQINKLKARVVIAQVGDVVNANQRLYPWAVLREAATDAQDRASRGELLMEAFHRTDAEGRNQRDLIQTVAHIKSVTCDELTKTVALDEIEFLPTSAGRDLMVVAKSIADSGGALQVSQRGEGRTTSTSIDGKPVQRVDELRIHGWDFVPPGDASVSQASLELVEGKEIEGGSIPMTDEEKKAAEEKAVNEAKEAEARAAEVKAADEKAANEQAPDVQAIVDAELAPIREELSKASTKIKEQEDAEALRETVKVNEVAIRELFEAEPEEGTENPYARFEGRDRDALVEGLLFHGTIEECQARLDERVMLFDRARAGVKLQGMGHEGLGIVGSSAVARQSVADLGLREDHKIITQKVRDLLRSEGSWIAADGTRDAHQRAILEQFDASYSSHLLNEADGTASDIADPVYTYSRIVLEQAMPLMKLLDLADVGTMQSLADVIWLETWSAALNAELNDMQVAEGDTAPQVNMTLAKYIIYASAKKIRTSLTPENIAMARGIPGYDMVARTLAGLTKDVARRLDYHLAGILVAASDAYAATTVTVNETLTQVGASTTWQSANRAWIEHEYVRKLITADNYILTRLNECGWDFDGTVDGTDAALQAVVVIDSTGSPKTLVRGWLQADGTVKTKAGVAADYYVKFADGQIVIAASPVSAPLTGPYKAKYTYTRNTVVCDMTPGVGITLKEHLLTVHQKVGQAKTVLVNRFYGGNLQAMSETTADLLSNSEKFTQAGGNVANQIGADNAVGRFSGLPIFSSTAFNDEKILLGSRGAVLYRVQQPFALSEWVIDTNTGNRSAVGVEFSAVDVPQPVKLITVSMYNYPMA